MVYTEIICEAAWKYPSEVAMPGQNPKSQIFNQSDNSFPIVNISFFQI